MSFEVEGTLHKKFETESKTETFQAREFVIKTEGQYPQFVKFQLTQDRCSLVDNFEEGSMIKVHFDLRGREWNEKYFTNLNAWKVEIQSEADQNTAVPATDEKFFPPESTSENKEEGASNSESFDDLPF